MRRKKQCENAEIEKFLEKISYKFNSSKKKAQLSKGIKYLVCTAY